MNELNPLLPLQLGRLNLVLDIVLVIAVLIIAIAVLYGVFLLRKIAEKKDK